MMDLFLSYPNTTLIGVFATLILLIHCLLRRILASKRKQPPEAAGGWPILGHLHLLTGPALPHEILAALADKHGPIFRIRVGIHTVVVVSSRETAKECFTTNDVAVSSRPRLVSGKHLGYNFANFTFAPYGSYWREMRRITTLQLLSNRRLQTFSHIRESEMAASLKELYDHWVMRHDILDLDHVQDEMTQWFEDLNLNVILRVIVGKRYTVATEPGKKKKAHRVHKTMRRLFHLAGLFLWADAIPFLGWLDLGGQVKAMKETAKEMDCLFAEWLEEHHDKLTPADSEAKNFIDVLLSMLDKHKIFDFDADTINKATVTGHKFKALVAGGSHTTAVASTWGLCLLLNNPSVLKKLQDELDTHVGRERLVRESDIGKLVYLQAVVKETLRLYPPGPLPGARQFTKDCNIGTQLIVNVYKLQRDPDVWEDPAKFTPERFLTTHKNIDVKGQHFELIPFGGGRRVCPGLGHGVQMAQLALASLLHAFDIRTPSGAPVDMTGSLGLTNCKATPLQV